MSKENRFKMYKKLLDEDRMSQDDGALMAEFGQPAPIEMATKELKKRKVKK